MTGTLKASPIRRLHDYLHARLFDCGAYLREYRELVNAASRRSDRLMSIGSGDGITLFRGANDPLVHRTVCVDLDEASLRRNPCPRRVVANAEALPFRDGAFDFVYCEHVLEHLASPPRVFAEIARILAGGGAFAFATPNGHSYVAWGARLVPFRLRDAVVRIVARAKTHHEHFETHYRANTVRALRRLARQSGLHVERLDGFVGEPCYTQGLPGIHLLAIAWHKVIEVAGLERVIGLTLVGSLVKRG